MDTAAKKPWSASLEAFAKPQVITLLFLGFSAGLPILMIFSSLSLWLREAGVERSMVTFFSWAALGYSFKFVWAPIVDRLPLPFLTKLLGRRRSWLLLAQLAVALAIVGMASVNPQLGGNALTMMAIAAVALGFSSATQDIVIDAYRIESASADLQAMMSSSYIAGYRIGMLLSGAGAIFLAQSFGSSKELYVYEAWRDSYLWMAAAMGIGILTTLIMPEPAQSNNKRRDSAWSYLRFLLLFALSVASLIAVYIYTKPYAAELSKTLAATLSNKPLASLLVESARLALAVSAALTTAYLAAMLNVAEKQMVQETYINPVRDFFQRYGLKAAWLLLAIVGLYRISDIVLGVMSNVFYQDLGYTKAEIAAAVKTFGLIMTIVGGFAGGILSVRFGLMKVLITGAVLAAGTNLLFWALANIGYNLPALYTVIAIDNLSAGLASAAFVAFLSSLTNISFTAMQYAIFSSLMTLIPKVFGGYSGSIVDAVGYPQFFLITTIMGLPVLLLLLIANKTLNLQQPKLAD